MENQELQNEAIDNLIDELCAIDNENKTEQPQEPTNEVAVADNAVADNASTANKVADTTAEQPQEPTNEVAELKALIAQQAQQIADLQGRLNAPQNNADNNLGASGVNDNDLLNSIGAASAQRLAQIEQRLQEREQQDALRAQLECIEKELVKRHPDIDVSRLVKYSQDNSDIFNQHNIADIRTWEMLINEMDANGVKMKKPDNIIVSGGTGTSAKADAFSRARNGEKVSDTDFGMELLNLIG